MQSIVCHVDQYNNVLVLHSMLGWSSLLFLSFVYLHSQCSGRFDVCQTSPQPKADRALETRKTHGIKTTSVCFKHRMHWRRGISDVGLRICGCKPRSYFKSKYGEYNSRPYHRWSLNKTTMTYENTLAICNRCLIAKRRRFGLSHTHTHTRLGLQRWMKQTNYFLRYP